MEQSIKAKFNKQVAAAGAAIFGVKFDQLSFLGAWQNFIYEYQEDGQSYILRFTPSSHRSDRLIQGELDWINYLSNHEISVSTPIMSKEGKWTEVIDAEDIYFTVTAFIKAKGRKVGYPECLDNTNLYQTLGKTMASMHVLSKNYKPKDENARRHHWYNNYYLENMHNFIPVSQVGVYEACTKLINTIKNSFVPNQSSYGLIHGDIGIGNYLLNDITGEITLFDFDEAQYSWFIEDIAIPLYYLVYVYGGDAGRRDRESQALRFMEHFMRGYNQANTIEDSWFKQIPLFLRLREIIVYTGMYRSADLSNLDEWSRDYLSESKTRIENGIPIVDIWN